MAKVRGNVKLKINSKLVKTVPDSVDLSVGGYQVTAEVADDSINQRNAKLMPASVKFEGLVTAGFTMKILNELTGATVEIISDVPGQSYLIVDAFRSGDPVTISSSNGRFSMLIEGNPCPDPT
jgi:hypothetical protein